jgi:hypothetical protein
MTRSADGQVNRRNARQRGDALALLRSQPGRRTPLMFFDPQYREVMDK